MICKLFGIVLHLYGPKKGWKFIARCDFLRLEKAFFNYFLNHTMYANLVVLAQIPILNWLGACKMHTNTHSYNYTDLDLNCQPYKWWFIYKIHLISFFFIEICWMHAISMVAKNKFFEMIYTGENTFCNVVFLLSCFTEPSELHSVKWQK